eukprot:355061-Chlamydomonas_euryale.AAC.11
MSWCSGLGSTASTASSIAAPRLLDHAVGPALSRVQQARKRAQSNAWCSSLGSTASTASSIAAPSAPAASGLHPCMASGWFASSLLGCSSVTARHPCVRPTKTSATPVLAVALRVCRGGWGGRWCQQLGLHDELVHQVLAVALHECVCMCVGACVCGVVVESRQPGFHDAPFDQVRDVVLCVREGGGGGRRAAAYMMT